MFPGSMRRCDQAGAKTGSAAGEAPSSATTALAVAGCSRPRSTVTAEQAQEAFKAHMDLCYAQMADRHDEQLSEVCTLKAREHVHALYHPERQYTAALVG